MNILNQQHGWRKVAIFAFCVAGLGALAACTPMVAGQMAEAGYTAARNTLGMGDGNSQQDAERQARLQRVINSIEIGQDIQPILEQVGEQPRIRSGNAYGYVCYEYPGVYSADEPAVIVAHHGKVAFYGSSRCNDQMQDSNFRKDGQYVPAEAAGKQPAAPVTQPSSSSELPSTSSDSPPISSERTSLPTSSATSSEAPSSALPSGTMQPPSVPDGQASPQ